MCLNQAADKQKASIWEKNLTFGKHKTVIKGAVHPRTLTHLLITMTTRLEKSGNEIQSLTKGSTHSGVLSCHSSICKIWWNLKPCHLHHIVSLTCRVIKHKDKPEHDHGAGRQHVMNTFPFLCGRDLKTWMASVSLWLFPDFWLQMKRLWALDGGLEKSADSDDYQKYSH